MSDNTENPGKKMADQMHSAAQRGMQTAQDMSRRATEAGMAGMAEFTRQIILDAAESVGVTKPTTPDGVEIDLFAQWRSVGIHELVSDAVGETVSADTDATQLRRLGS